MQLQSEHLVLDWLWAHPSCFDYPTPFLFPLRQSFEKADNKHSAWLPCRRSSVLSCQNGGDDGPPKLSTSKMEMMERPLLPWSLQRTPLLFFATFFCSFLGAINDPVQIPLHPVNGVLRRSVLLSVNSISPSEKVTRVEWAFQPQNGTGLSIAELRDGKLERPDPKDRFGSRLDLVNETTLRIRILEKEDSGVYKAWVRLPPAKIEEHSFHLTIYDPVLEPQILLLQESFDSSAGCNVTLQCLVSEKGRLNVSWRIGDAIEPLEGGLDWYQFSSEGWNLHLSNLSNPTDSNVTCLVSNPADQKSASIDLTGTCSHPCVRKRYWWLIFPIAIGMMVAFGSLFGFWSWKKKRKQSRYSEDSAADSALEANKAPDVQYMEVQSTRRPSEGDNDQERGSLSKPSPAAASPTIYAMVQAPSSLPPDPVA